MNSEIDNYNNKIKSERERIEKLKIEIDTFKERKNIEIIAAKNRILQYQQQKLKI